MDASKVIELKRKMQASTKVFWPAQFKQYDVNGPRYTSYPTADRFVEAFSEADYQQALVNRHLTARG